MKNYTKLLLLLLTALFFTACSQKVYVKALVPAEIDRVSNTKKISVSSFKNDTVGLSNKIEASLASFEIDNKNYFTLVSRKDFDKIIKEQEIQNSGLMDPSKAVKVGELMGAEAIISGTVTTPSIQNSYYYEKRSKCADKKCEKFIKYSVRCMRRVVSLSSELRIVDVTQGDIIFADTPSKSSTYRKCSDQTHTIPSVEVAAQRLSSSIANAFTYRLAPHYKRFSVALLEDPDLDYSDKQEELLEYSLEYVEQSRYSKAEDLLKRLVDSTASQSYVPFYNLGVISEARGKYVDAKEYYSYADNIMVEPVEEINEALIRIDRLIAQHKKTKEQINR